MIYVLLGMHKSGTTMLSQILHDSGINMGDFDETKKYDEGNKYERLETHDLNIEILGTKYMEHSLNVSEVVKDFSAVSPEILQKLKDFIRTTDAKYNEWGFKDPRTCLTYSIWKDVLPSHKIVAVYRHPSELWSHYRRQKFWHLIKYISICWKSMNAWYVYNREVLNILKATAEPFFLAEYNQFMLKPEIFKSLCEFTQTALKDSRNSSMYRSKQHSDFLFRLILWLHKTVLGHDIMGLYEEMSHFTAHTQTN